MISVNKILFLIGFCLVFPFVYIPLGVVNLKVDDLLVILLVFVGLLSKELVFKKNIAFLTFFFIINLIYGIGLRFFFNIDYDNYPLVRVLGIILYFVGISFFMVSYRSFFSLIRGVYNGGRIMFLLMLVVLVYQALTVGVLKSLYSLKDSLRLLPGDYNPNTYGALMVFCSFASMIIHKHMKEDKYLYWAVIFLLMPFVFLIKRDILGVLIGGVYFVVAKMENRFIKNLCYFCIILGLYWIVIKVVSLWSDSEFITLMAHRVQIYTGSFNLIKTNLYGYGLGSEIELLKVEMGRPFVSHNSFLAYALELGVFNSLAFISILLVIFKKYKNIFLRFFFLVFFVQSFMGNGFYYYKYHFIFLLISIYYTVFFDEKSKVKNII